MSSTDVISDELLSSDDRQTTSGKKQSSWFEYAAVIAVGIMLLVRLGFYYKSLQQPSVEESALKLASQNPVVRRVFGQPLKTLQPISWTKGRDEIDWKEAKLVVPVYGPKVRGTLRLAADRGAGGWLFSRLEIVSERRPHAPVDLLREELSNFAAKPAQDGTRAALVLRFTSGFGKQGVVNNSVERTRPTLEHEAAVDQGEIDLETGIFVLRQTDIFIPDSIPVALTRTYRSRNAQQSAFGTGTSHPYDIWPTGTRNPYTEINLMLEDGSAVYFARTSAGTGFADAVYRHDQTSTEFYHSRFFWNGDGWTLRFADGRKVFFPEAYNARTAAQGAATEMEDDSGKRLLLQRDGQRRLQRIVSPSGQTITLKYNDSAQIVEADDRHGHSREYTYDATGHVAAVSEGNQVLYRFSYERLIEVAGEDSFLMTHLDDATGRTFLQLTYDTAGRVATAKLADGRMFQLEYGAGTNDGRTVAATVLTIGSGKPQTFLF